MGNKNGYNECRAIALSWVLAKLREISNKKGVSEIEVLSDFIEDLRNWKNEDYEHKIEIFIDKIDDSVRRDMIPRLSKELRRRQEIERIQKGKQERAEKKAKAKVEKAKETAEKKEQERKVKVDKAWEEICQIVGKQSKENCTPEYELWIKVRELKFPSDSTQKLSDIESKVKQKLEDEIYYQKVKYFTYDFKFLSQFPEFAMATGVRRKIDDKRYLELRREMQKYGNEEETIQMMLTNSNINDVTRRILESRLQKMQIQKEESMR